MGRDRGLIGVALLVVLAVVVALPATAAWGAGAAAPASIWPKKDYAADLWSRRYRTADWDAWRTTVAEHGVTLDVDMVQACRGIVKAGSTTTMPPPSPPTTSCTSRPTGWAQFLGPWFAVIGGKIVTIDGDASAFGRYGHAESRDVLRTVEAHPSRDRAWRHI